MRLLVPGFSIGMPGRRLIRLADYYGLPLVTLNSLITSSIQEQTCLGNQARACLEKGRLIPDLLTLQLLEERLTEPGMYRDWIVSGFPCNLAQATALNSMLSDIGQPCDMAVYIESDDLNAADLTVARSNESRDRPVISLPPNQCTTVTHSNPTHSNPTHSTANALKTTPLANFYIQHGLFFRVDDKMTFSKIMRLSQLSPTAFSEV